MTVTVYLSLFAFANSTIFIWSVLSRIRFDLNIQFTFQIDRINSIFNEMPWLKSIYVLLFIAVKQSEAMICSRYPANTLMPKSPVDENFVVTISGNPQTYILGQEYNGECQWRKCLPNIRTSHIFNNKQTTIKKISQYCVWVCIVYWNLALTLSGLIRRTLNLKMCGIEICI